MDYFFIEYGKKSIIGEVKNNSLFNISNLYNDDIFGNIYRARVENIVPSMRCAFINIGEGKKAYLNLKEEKNLSIKEGEEVIVQVKKAPLGDKGATVTLDYSLKGEYLVLLPKQDRVFISNKINSEKSSIIDEFLGDNKPEVGVIFRTKSVTAELNDLEVEYKSLLEDAKFISSQKNFLPTPKLIYKNSEIKNYLLDNYELNLPIYTNDKDVYNYLRSFEKYKDFVIFKQDFSIFLDRKLNRDYLNLEKREIKLDNGSNIIIDKTEAITVIDVNSSKSKGNMSFEENIMETNKLASVEIAKQIRLRDISGIIIIDFINMKEKKNRESLLSFFKEELKLDNKNPNLHGYTSLGLVELSRKRQGKSFEAEKWKNLNK